MLRGFRHYKMNWLRGGLHYIRTPLRLKPFKVKKLFWADIIEEEMAHQTQASVLSHLHLQQAEEIKSQSNEIRHLSTLLEKQQAILERVQEQQSRMPEIPVPPMNRIEELQRRHSIYCLVLSMAEEVQL